MCTAVEERCCLTLLLTCFLLFHLGPPLTFTDVPHVDVAQAEDAEARRNLLIEVDFNFGQKLGKQHLIDEIQNTLDTYVGMDDVKVWLDVMKKKAMYVEKTGDRAALKTCLNLVCVDDVCTSHSITASLKAQNKVVALGADKADPRC